MDFREILEALRKDFKLISRKFHMALAEGNVELANEHYLHGEHVKAQIITVKKQLRGEN